MISPVSVTWTTVCSSVRQFSLSSLAAGLLTWMFSLPDDGSVVCCMSATTGTCSKVHVMSSSTCCTAKLDNTKIVNMERNVDKIVGGGFNNLQNNSSCSSMCGKMDVDSLSLVDDSSSEHSVRLKQYEPPSVRSPLLSTAYL